MATFTDIFSGGGVNLSQALKKDYTLTASIETEWPGDVATTENILGDINKVSSSNAAFTFKLPDATKASEGAQFVIHNVGAANVPVIDFDDGAVVTITPGQGVFIYLDDNATDDGAWQVFTLGAGTSAADAAALASDIIIAAGQSLKSAMPVSSTNVNTSVGAPSRGYLMNWIGGVGTFTLSSASVLGNNWYCGVKNSGSGALTIALTNGEIDGAASLALNPGEGAIIVCDGTDFYTLDKAAAGGGSFSFISIGVGGTGDYTLSAVEQGFSAYRFTGTLTGNRNIIVPTTLNQYVITNGTTGAFTFTVKTAAGTGVVVGTGESKIVYCDGTNVVDAATAGISVPVAVNQGGTGATTAAGARTNLGSGVIGDALFTAGTATSARSTLGAGATGDTIFTAADAAAARTAIGATATGSSLITAADAAAVRTAAGATATGSSLITAAAASDARTAIGATATGSSLITAASASAALAALEINRATAAGNGVVSTLDFTMPSGWRQADFYFFVHVTGGSGQDIYVQLFNSTPTLVSSGYVRTSIQLTQPSTSTVSGATSEAAWYLNLNIGSGGIAFGKFTLIHGGPYASSTSIFAQTQQPTSGSPAFVFQGYCTGTSTTIPTVRFGTDSGALTGSTYVAMEAW